MKNNQKEELILRVIDKLIKIYPQPWFNKYAVLIFEDGHIIVVVQGPAYSTTRLPHVADLNEHFHKYLNQWLPLRNQLYYSETHIGHRYKAIKVDLRDPEEKQPVTCEANFRGVYELQ